MKKRILSILLTLVMVFGLLPANASAADDSLTPIHTIEIMDVIKPISRENISYGFTALGDEGYQSLADSNGDIVFWSRTGEAPESYAHAAQNVWAQPSDGQDHTYEGGYYYTVMIHLKPVEGYRFAEDITATVNGNAANIFAMSEENYVVWYTFFCKKIKEDLWPVDSVQIQNVTQPVIGQEADYSFTVPEYGNYDIYTDAGISAHWIVTDAMPSDYEDLVFLGDWYDATMEEKLVFETGKYYTFFAYTQVADGYRYDDDDLSVTVNGQFAQYWDYEPTQYSVWYTFECEDRSNMQPVEKADLHDITAPVDGETASYAYSIPTDKGYDVYSDIDNPVWIATDRKPETIADLEDGDWNYSYEYEPLVFEGGKYYTFAAVLETQNGYYWADSFTAVINGAQANLNRWYGDKYMIWYTFHCAEPPARAEYTLILEAGNAYMDSVDSANILTVPGITAVSDGTGWTYTFDNVDFRTNANRALWIYDDNATVNLVGHNVIMSGDSAKLDTYGLVARGNLTFTGNGSMKAVAGKAGAATNGNGIWVHGTMTVKSGDITGDGGKSGAGTIGIYSYKLMTIEGGSVTAIAGTASAAAIAMGSDECLSVKGGTVKATVGYAPIGCGILAFNMDITGGTVTVDARDSQSGYALAYGASDASKFRIAGGTVELKAATYAVSKMVEGAFSASAPSTSKSVKILVAASPYGENAVEPSTWKGDGSDDVSGYRYMLLEGTAIAGDINGDGEVNNKDLTRLFQFLSGYQVTVEEAVLDVNDDGSVNNKDLTRLFQYLSGYDVKIY